METEILIPEDTFAEMVTEAVQNVLSTMVQRDTELVENNVCAGHEASSRVHLPIEANQSLVVGTVGFLGKANGVIYLYMEDALARILSCGMLGMEESDLEDDGNETVNDAIGELTNMIVGNFKNSLCDKGYPCSLTIPSILRGSHFTIQPITNALRRIYKFQTGGHYFVADLLLQPGE